MICYKRANINDVHQCVRYNQGSHCPQEDAPGMHFGDVVPEMFVKKVIRHSSDDKERNQAERQEGNL